MTNEEQNKYWLDFHRFQMRQEIIYTPKINKVLKAQVQKYIETKDTIYIRSSELYGLLKELHTNVGVAWAWKTRSQMKKDGGQMGFSERIVSFMRRYFYGGLLNDAENITQTTIRTIQEVLSEAALTGWSFDEIVKRIVSPDFTAIRAKLIARTETVAAANGGSMANATATGLPLNKIWIAAKDSRTRLHHREINQTVVAKEAKFIVGGMPMDYPGDKAGGAAECCNCRCTVAFIPI